MPQALTRWTETVLSASSDIMLVVQLNVPALRQLRRLLDVLHDEGLYTLPYRVVLNRHAGRSFWRSGVGYGQAEKALGRAPVERFRRELAAAWGDPTTRRMLRFPLSLRVGRA